MWWVELAIRAVILGLILWALYLGVTRGKLPPGGPCC
jgi:hypothetical protein